jgi:hypothetical protein
MAMSGSSSSFCATTEQAITQPEIKGHLEVIQGQLQGDHAEANHGGHHLLVRRRQTLLRCYRGHFEVFQTLSVHPKVY